MTKDKFIHIYNLCAGYTAKELSTQCIISDSLKRCVVLDGITPSVGRPNYLEIQIQVVWVSIKVQINTVLFAAIKSWKRVNGRPNNCSPSGLTTAA